MSRSNEGSLLGRAAGFLFVLGGVAFPSGVPVVAQASAGRVRTVLDGNTYEMGRIDWIGIAPNGDIVLSHPSEAVLRRLRSGERIPATIGRRGGGPGEFQSIVTLGWVAGDLWVYDRSNVRVTVLDAAGRLRREFRVPTVFDGRSDQAGSTPHSYGLPWVRAILPDDRYVVEARPRGNPEQMRNAVSALLRVEQDSSLATEILSFPPVDCHREVLVDGNPGSIRIPFCVDALVGVDPRGSYAVAIEGNAPPGSMARWCLTTVEIATGSRQQRCHTERATPVTNRDVDTALARLEERAPHPDLKRAARALDRLPKYFPLFRAIKIGPDGTTWLERWWGGGPRRWVVLDRAGAVVTSVSVPNGLEIRAVERDRALGVLESEDGVESVAELRIQ